MKITVLYRNGRGMEEFTGAEIDTSKNESILLIYDEDGRIKHMIPFDAVLSIDFDWPENEDEEEMEENEEGKVDFLIEPRSSSFMPSHYWK